MNEFLPQSIISETQMQYNKDYRSQNLDTIKIGIINKEAKLQQQIHKMKQWLNNNTIEYYQELLKNQSRLYTQMQQKINRNNEILKTISQKEYQKMKILESIAEYDQLLKQWQNKEQTMISKQKYRRQRSDLLLKQTTMKNDEQQIMENKKIKIANKKNIRYLKDKIDRISKDINQQSSIIKIIRKQTARNNSHQQISINHVNLSNLMPVSTLMSQQLSSHSKQAQQFPCSLQNLLNYSQLNKNSQVQKLCIYKTSQKIVNATQQIYDTNQFLIV